MNEYLAGSLKTNNCQQIGHSLLLCDLRNKSNYNSITDRYEKKKYKIQIITKEEHKWFIRA